MPSRNSFTELISSFRINSACGYSVEETCPYCSAPVHFESTDVAICRESHTLTRCRASIILCSVLQPVWHCVCCGGMVAKLLVSVGFVSETRAADFIKVPLVKSWLEMSCTELHRKSITIHCKLFCWWIYCRHQGDIFPSPSGCIHDHNWASLEAITLPVASIKKMTRPGKTSTKTLL